MLQKIKTIKIIFSFFMMSAMVFCFGNCGTKEENRAAKLEQEIMDIHDSVMPEMSHVLRLRREISQLMETPAPVSAKDSLQQVSYQLTKADQEMMNWMHQYHDPGTGSDTAIRYLEDQHVKISSLAVNIHAAISQGEKMVEQYSNKH